MYVYVYWNRKTSKGENLSEGKHEKRTFVPKENAKRKEEKKKKNICLQTSSR